MDQAQSRCVSLLCAGCLTEVFAQAGWKDNYQTFINELKNLRAFDLSLLGVALKTSFDLLNLFRLQSGIDNYGMVC